MLGIRVGEHVMFFDVVYFAIFFLLPSILVFRFVSSKQAAGRMNINKYGIMTLLIIAMFPLYIRIDREVYVAGPQDQREQIPDAWVSLFEFDWGVGITNFECYVTQDLKTPDDQPTLTLADISNVSRVYVGGYTCQIKLTLSREGARKLFSATLAHNRGKIQYFVNHEKLCGEVFLEPFQAKYLTLPLLLSLDDAERLMKELKHLSKVHD